ncbi:MAG TPA: L,D-transpeptidase family protein [Thermoanaerobaculia bacterium]|jgi:peptidoglycan hydrolase-like protein with peptidoglycan-binding domain
MSPYRRSAVSLAVALLPLLAIPAVASPKPIARAVPTPLTRADIRQAEQQLADLGYWTGPIDGVWDDVSRHALIAFQKVEHARATGKLTRAELNALSVATPPRPRELGQHIEVDLARQVLFLVDADGKVGNILPISSGSGKTFHEKGYPETHAVTPCGHLEVFSRASGWKTSALGQMYNPLYIVGGIAIHGSLDVPAYPASHGCIRVPMFASQRLPRMVPNRTPVYVYGCKDDVPPNAIAAVPAPVSVAAAEVGAGDQQ